MDKEWELWLKEPPGKAVEERRRLQERAYAIADDFLAREASFSTEANTKESVSSQQSFGLPHEQKESEKLEQSFGLPHEIDVIVAGSGFKCLYFLGVHQVLARLEMQGRVKIRRYAGASSGAQTPFQIVLYGEPGVIDRHLAYGILCDKYIPNAGTVHQVRCMKRHWMQWQDWMFGEYSTNLTRVDGRVFVSVSILRRRGLQHRAISHWSTDDDISYSAVSSSSTAMTHSDAIDENNTGHKRKPPSKNLPPPKQPASTTPSSALNPKPSLICPKRTRQAYHASGTILTRFGR